MYRHKFCAIRERGFNLYLFDHLGYSVHNLVTRQDRRAEAHQLGVTATIACTLHYCCRDQRDAFRVIQFDAAIETPLGDVCRDKKQQFVFFSGTQFHLTSICAR